MTELLKQPQYAPLPVCQMAVSLFAVNEGFIDDVDVKKVLPFEHGLHEYLKSQPRRPVAKHRERQGAGQGGRGQS